MTDLSVLLESQLAIKRRGREASSTPERTLMRIPIDLRLARHGAILLLLGMLTGFVILNFHCSFDPCSARRVASEIGRVRWQIPV
jgi:hypothetical protein